MYLQANYIDYSLLFFSHKINGKSWLFVAEPPTAVRNLMVIDRTNTSITIRWTTPTITGRPDYYYNIEYSDPDDASRYIKHNQKEITNTNMYRVTGLRPNTTYVIRVSVHNGVSRNDSANDDDRREQVAANTEEGGKP